MLSSSRSSCATQYASSRAPQVGFGALGDVEVVRDVPVSGPPGCVPFRESGGSVLTQRLQQAVARCGPGPVDDDE